MSYKITKKIYGLSTSKMSGGEFSIAIFGVVECWGPIPLKPFNPLLDIKNKPLVSNSQSWLLLRKQSKHKRKKEVGNNTVYGYSDIYCMYIHIYIAIYREFFMSHECRLSTGYRLNSLGRRRLTKQSLKLNNIQLFSIAQHPRERKDEDGAILLHWM